MAEEFTGTIVEWNEEKAHGYLRYGKKRIFLHIRDFSERHKRPAIGDRIRFLAGTDGKGRPCAVKAAHVNDGGRLGIGSFIVLGLLLLLPAIAWCCLPRPLQWVVGVLYGSASALTWFLYGRDKQIARQNASATSPQRSRVPESQLHLLEFAGGWPAAFIAKRRLRHKCSKLSYQAQYWLIVTLHEFLAFDFLCDWQIIRAILAYVDARPV